MITARIDGLVWRAAVVPGTLAVAAIAGGCGSARVSDAPPDPSEISGRYIAAICDADMGATAFADSRLARPSESARDAMTVVGLPIAPPPGADATTWRTSVAQVPVSNSVVGPTAALAVSPDGTRAYVAETRGQAGPGASTMRDLPPGRKVTMINLDDPANPVLAAELEGLRSPAALDVHPAGDLLAIAPGDEDSDIWVVPVGATGFGDPVEWELPGLPEEMDGAKPAGVAWHPDGRHLAVTYPGQDAVAFFEFTRDGAADGAMGLAPWGAPVKVGKHPYAGRFTPDGRHFVTADLHWGQDVEGYLVGAPEGSVTVVRLSTVESAVAEGAPEVRHEVASTATVGISPEGLAVSPDGRWVVTANLRRSMLPATDPRVTMGGSLSLLGLDGKTGELISHGEFPLKAMPEGICFDAAGRHVVVTQFRSFDPQAVDGELAFFKLVPGREPRLVPGDFYVGVGVGPHGVVIVR